MLAHREVCAGLRELVRLGRIAEEEVPWSRCYEHSWVVYCKPPFGSPSEVLGYLARYSYRVAISNDRLRGFDGRRVRYGYRDSRCGEAKEETLDALEFLSRFLEHVLPRAFVRIRSYGLLANRCRRGKLAQSRRILAVAQRRVALSAAQILARLLGRPPDHCPRCRQPTLSVSPRRSPSRQVI